MSDTDVHKAGNWDLFEIMFQVWIYPFKCWQDLFARHVWWIILSLTCKQGSCINMFAYAISNDIFTISVFLFQFRSTVTKTNSVWVSLTKEEKLFTNETDRCDILLELNNWERGNLKKSPKNSYGFIGIH